MANIKTDSSKWIDIRLPHRLILMVRCAWCGRLHEEAVDTRVFVEGILRGDVGYRFGVRCGGSEGCGRESLAVAYYVRSLSSWRKMFRPDGSMHIVGVPVTLDVEGALSDCFGEPATISGARSD